MQRLRALQIITGAGMAALASPLGAQSLSTVRIGATTSEATGSVFYAQDLGLFAKHGVGVTINTATSGSAVASAIIGGDLDAGETAIATLAMAHDQGLPFAYIAPAELDSLKAPTLACIVGDASMKTGKDFNGKTMACNVPRGFGSLIMSAWIDSNGGDSKTVKWIGLPFPTLVASLQRGTIDGYIAPEPFVSAGMAGGGHLIMFEKGRLAPAFLQAGWFATKDWIAKNTTAANALAAAIREANEWANANMHPRAGILSKYSTVPVNVIEASRLPGQYGTQLDPALIQPVIDVAAKYSYIAKRFPASDIIAKMT
jgi:NitT/TauT family transport system substrate-binding protein